MNPYLKSEYTNLALMIALGYRCTRKGKERAVRAAAQNGFHGWFPELPQKVLQRNPTPEEIVLLIDTYVSDKVSSCHRTEEKLSALARTYLPKDNANLQIARIDEFVREFNSRFDL